MLTIIDRYMLRQFIQVFMICLMSLIGLYIVIDAFSHLDHFVDDAGKHGNLLMIMGAYYAYRSIGFFDRMSGTLTLIAVMFTITWIQRHQEMTALLAAGVTRVRVLRPVLLAAVCVSLLAAANRELVIPNIREHLANDSRNVGGDQQVKMQSRMDTQSYILINGENIVPAMQTVVNPSFALPRGLDKFGKSLAGKEARYLEADKNHPNGYLLSSLTTPKALLKSPSLMLNGQAIVITPVGNDWLEHDQVFIASDVSFEFLAAGASWQDFASTSELIQQLHNPSTELGADARVAIHSRFLRPFLDTTLLMLGVPFVVARTNRNPFIAVGLSLLVVTTFMLVALGCQSLGSSGWLEAPLAAWLPLMIFAPLAAGSVDALRQ